MAKANQTIFWSTIFCGWFVSLLTKSEKNCNEQFLEIHFHIQKEKCFVFVPTIWKLIPNQLDFPNKMQCRIFEIKISVYFNAFLKMKCFACLFQCWTLYAKKTNIGLFWVVQLVLINQEEMVRSILCPDMKMLCILDLLLTLPLCMSFTAHFRLLDCNNPRHRPIELANNINSKKTGPIFWVPQLEKYERKRKESHHHKSSFFLLVSLKISCSPKQLWKTSKNWNALIWIFVDLK